MNERYVYVTGKRIRQAERQEGYYYYNIRHSECGKYFTLEKHVTVNHYATVVTNEPIKTLEEYNENNDKWIDLSGDEEEAILKILENQERQNVLIHSKQEVLAHHLQLHVNSINVKADNRFSVNKENRIGYEEEWLIFHKDEIDQIAYEWLYGDLFQSGMGWQFQISYLLQLTGLTLEDLSKHLHIDLQNDMNGICDTDEAFHSMIAQTIGKEQFVKNLQESYKENNRYGEIFSPSLNGQHIKGDYFLFLLG
ncbi:LPD28 domain-containing protein [Bacillus salitolerans]|uniref:LPD28 domain-containing protein n=1 Tax=Bacillus salitolerans TaxID=1437434 RepID=A0ABW4LPU4_9BACI